jgi:hypothetical protein
MTGKKKYTLLLLFIILISLVNHADEKKNWRCGIIRVNTKVSAGQESFDEVARKARRKNLDFVVFTDQFVVKAEYGIPPFRNIIKVSKKRPGVTSFGIEQYLDAIKSTDEKYSDIILIPGVDVAPHYYWEGYPFVSNFACRQYSEQLTIIGPQSPEFYADIPVIHNEKSEISLFSILKLLPLLLVLAGSGIIINRKNRAYRDAQGNTYTPNNSRKEIIASVLLITVGTLWTLNNKPFTNNNNFHQYKSFGILPYQKLIDYVDQYSSKEQCGVFWSAPEAEMRDKIAGVKLLTTPYMHDVTATDRHNGFAGIYGDVFTAHRPGGEWDKMLLQYCRGSRAKPPVIIGELDYHGKKRRIDMIQTVVNVDQVESSKIVEAIVHGHSYAYSQPLSKQIKIGTILVSCGPEKGSLGEVIKRGKNADAELEVSGSITGLGSITNISLSVVVNGQLLSIQRQYGNKFDFKVPIKAELLKNQRKNYIRMMIRTNNAGQIFTNPIYIQN